MSDREMLLLWIEWAKKCYPELEGKKTLEDIKAHYEELQTQPERDAGDGGD